MESDTEREASATVKNPFSSRKISIGAIPFLSSHEKETDFQTFIKQFTQTGHFAQIVGPHGTGKSTFLNEFLSRFQEQSKRIHAVTLRDKQRCLPQEFRESLAHPDHDTIAVVDGYEQLGVPDRFFLRFFHFRRRCGLLLTSHRRIPGIPVLLKTKPDFRTLLEVVDFLLRDIKTASPRFEVSQEELRNLFQQHKGNLRMVLLSLYDRYEDFDGCLCGM